MCVWWISPGEILCKDCDKAHCSTDRANWVLITSVWAKPVYSSTHHHAPPLVKWNNARVRSKRATFQKSASKKCCPLNVSIHATLYTVFCHNILCLGIFSCTVCTGFAPHGAKVSRKYCAEEHCNNIIFIATLQLFHANLPVCVTVRCFEQAAPTCQNTGTKYSVQ